jgi:hypothetical protein
VKYCSYTRIVIISVLSIIGLVDVQAMNQVDK